MFYLIQITLIPLFMNAFYSLKTNASARALAFLTVLSLLVSSLPLAVFTANAASDAVGTLTAFVLPNPSDGAGEYVDLQFVGTGTLELAGWTIFDANRLLNDNPLYTFTETDILTNGDELRLCGNMALVTNCDIVYPGGNTVWNNTTDTLTLKDEAGVTVLEFDWTDPFVEGLENGDTPVDFSAEEEEEDEDEADTSTSTEPTGSITVDPTVLETTISTQVNFVVSAEYENLSSTQIVVSDDSTTGLFFGGNTAGECNSATVVEDNTFIITNNKGICYSNSVAGDYEITAQLVGGASSTPVGEAVVIEVSVLAGQDETGTTTDEGTGTTTDDGTGTTTDNGSGTTTDNGTGTTTDDGAGGGDDDETGAGSGGGGGSAETAGECEIEAHKYDSEGNPLSGWMLGLMKVIYNDEFTNTYSLAEQETGADGYVCLEWDGETRSPLSVEGEITGNDYNFDYYVYETLQDGWTNWSIEAGADFNNLVVVPDEDVRSDGFTASVQIGETNGFLIKGAAFHVDFYNLLLNGVETGTSTDDGTGTTTDDGTSTTTDDGTDTTVNEVPRGGGGSLASPANRGGSSGGSSSSDDELEEAGAAPLVVGTTNNDNGSGDGNTPAAQVLGDQVSVVPFGGADTGAGGSAPQAASLWASLLLAVLAAGLRFTRRFVA